MADLEKLKKSKAGIAVKLMTHMKIAMNFNKNLFFIFRFSHVKNKIIKGKFNNFPITFYFSLSLSAASVAFLAVS